ncbi:T9SS type A sorting domain-containing protein [Emticicia sp. C21]|uniref:T9SS type A sorting domain-containing protein n=1 Tax=Emticicia sp. C21 TaxID=2302915 RepID=UPI000E350D4B|nr:T9SS type A sorting domain-containing protein [Emticicia sp. C21]RFS16007.1 T9SS C-terminal target domain-containing protein [Emticicia sp. C21]
MTKSLLSTYILFITFLSPYFVRAYTITDKAFWKEFDSGFDTQLFDSTKTNYSDRSLEALLESKKCEIATPYIYSIVGSSFACKGYVVPLQSASFDNSIYTKYSWRHNGKVVEEGAKKDLFEAKESGYYKLTVYQGSCEATSDSVSVEIGQNLSNEISGDRAIINNKVALCESFKTTFYHNGYRAVPIDNQQENIAFLKKYGLSLQWKHNDKNITKANDINYTASEPGVYYLQLTQGECIANSKKIEIVRRDTLYGKLSHNYPFSDEKKTVSLCKDKNAFYSLDVSDGYTGTYDWYIDFYRDGKLIETRTPNSDYTNRYFTIKESGKYWAKTYSPAQKSCAILSDTTVFDINNGPITLLTDTISVCSDFARLAFDPPGSGGITEFQWFYNGNLMGDYFSPRAYEEGLYTVQTRQYGGCIFIKSFLIKKNFNPRITYSWNTPFPSNTTICDGKKIDLFLVAVDDRSRIDSLDFSIEWYNNQQKLADRQTRFTLNQAGNYYAKLKYNNCEAISNIIKVDLMQTKNQISPLPSNSAICLNTESRTIEASKEPGYTYEWFKDNISLGETSSALKVNEDGVYKAIIDNGDCSVLTPSVKVYANTQPLTATISGDTTVSMGDMANLKLSFTSSPPFTYKLGNNQEGTTDKNKIIHSVKIQESTIFKLTSIKNACGEGTVSGEAKVNVIILGNEPLVGHKIYIAPIPAESYCEIIFDLLVSQEVSYQLLDMKGQQLSEKNLGNVTYKKQYLNLNYLAAGEYLIRMQVGKDFVTRKLIKY